MQTFQRSLRAARVLSLLLVILAGPVFEPVASANQRAGARAGSAEILWDKWGVPHVFAKNDEALFYAFGWAQAHSHGDTILRLYGRARGRAAEYWGEKQLDSDKWVRTVGIPARGREWYAAQEPRFRRHLDAFTSGINDYAAKHPERIAADVKAVLPVNGADIMAHAQRVLHFTFVTGPGAVQGAARSMEERGSNAWAIAPGKSAGRHAMLLANPHLPWSGLFLWYEAQVSAPGVNAYGAALVGFPMPVIAFNEHLGWSHTVNTYDGADHYELTLSEGGYRFDGKTRPFETEEQTIKVRRQDGTHSEERLVIRRSAHGPVVFEKGGRAIALRVAGLDRPGLLAQYWEMLRARNLVQFEAALARLQQPMFNVVYADRAGHVMYLFNGLVPVRKKGDWRFWSGLVPGDVSETLWTSYHPYSDLPRVVDPPSRWVQNANDPPWTATFPLALDPNKFPAYLSPRGMGFRPQRSVRMLLEDSSITFDEMIRYKHSTRMELADRILDDLLAAARSEGGDAARQAADVLEKWDRTADAESRGAALFTLWAQEVGLLAEAGNPKIFATPWDERHPLSTPDGLASPKDAAAALERAAAKVRFAFGSLDVAWGEVARLRAGKYDLPANGSFGPLGIFRVLGLAPGTDGRFRSVSGDTFVAAVEFSNPVRARTLMSYGNSTQPGSPHAGDQLELFARKELRPVWLTRKEIEANLASREVVR